MSPTHRYDELAVSHDPLTCRLALAQLERLTRQSRSHEPKEPTQRAQGVDLVALVTKSVGPFRPRPNGTHVGPCPWHASRSGTCLVVWPDTGRWWCSSCHRGGDAVAWLALVEGVTFDEARRRLGAPPDPKRIARRPTIRREVVLP